MKDISYAIVGRFDGREELWRFALFDTPDEAREYWRIELRPDRELVGLVRLQWRATGLSHEFIPV